MNTRMWFHVLSHFSMINFSLPIKLAQHHQRRLIIALIDKLTCWQSLFLAISDKAFLIDFGKCHTSNWCNISGYSLLKNDLIWTCRSVVSVVIFIEFKDFLTKVCNPFFPFLLELPAVLTWTTKKSIMF